MPKIASKIPPDTLVLPLLLPSTPAFPSAATHYLYVQRHKPSPGGERSPDPTRSLYLINLPIDATTHSLRTLFSSLSSSLLESTTLPTTTSSPPPLLKPGTNTIATFVDRESCEAALKTIAGMASTKSSKTAATAISWPGTPANELPLGLERYRQKEKARYPDPVEAVKEVDRFMAEFARMEEEERKAAARRRQVPDEDGFVTVTRGPKAVKADALDAPGVGDAANAKKKDKGELNGFYRFQIREERKRKQQELVKEFERDRAEVEERKRKRRFVPQD